MTLLPRLLEPALVPHKGGRPGRRLALEALEDRSCPSISLLFDYSFDSSGFFSSPQARATLELAGQLVGSRLGDSLAPLQPSGTNRWTAGVTNPGTGGVEFLSDLNVPADTLLVFVGGRNYGGAALGVGGYGSSSAVGSTAWLEAVSARGQAGALSASPRDFGPWGGSLSFDTASRWSFGDAATPPAAGTNDFLSVAVHELTHLLGLGTAPSWYAQIASGSFVGPAATAVYGGGVPLEAGGGHWAFDVQSGGQEPALTPALTVGERKLYTALDLAGLQDVGWETGLAPAPAPEPAPTPVPDPAPADPVPPPLTPASGPGGLFFGPGGGETPGVFDPQTGTWYLRSALSSGVPDVGRFAFGAPGWVPVAGDWDGDGRAGIGVYDPASGTWYLRNSASTGVPDAGQFAFGAPGWVPVVGDWDGDGRTGIGVYDPASGTWYLSNFAGAGVPDAGVFAFGAPGWVPVAGDWDGDGDDSVGVFDAFTASWYLKNFNAPGAPDVAPFVYGVPGWSPVAGDWNGDGIDSVGVVDGAGTWYTRNRNSSGAPEVAPFVYGVPGWGPVAGRWSGSPFAALTAADPDGQATFTHLGTHFCCCAACRGAVAGDASVEEASRTSAGPGVFGAALAPLELARLLRDA